MPFCWQRHKRQNRRTLSPFFILRRVLFFIPRVSPNISGPLPISISQEKANTPNTRAMSETSPVTRAVVLISGSGTNLQAIIDSTSPSKDGVPARLPNLKIIRVFSNRKGVLGLERAEKAGIATTYHNLIAGKYHKAGEKDPKVKSEARERYDVDLANLILDETPDIIICAGWMHILTPSFLDPLAAKDICVINLHPALPGKYDGAGAIERAFADFEAGTLENDTTGIMIHYVVSEVDRGQPIVTREIRIEKGQSLKELEDVIHTNEHELIVEGAGKAIQTLWESRKGKE